MWSVKKHNSVTEYVPHQNFTIPQCKDPAGCEVLNHHEGEENSSDIPSVIAKRNGLKTYHVKVCPRKGAKNTTIETVWPELAAVGKSIESANALGQ